MPIVKGQKDEYLSGWKAGKTSRLAAHEAAETAEGTIQRIRKWMHQQLTPVTADEIADGLRLDPLSVRPRLTAMKKRNLIRDSGLVGKSRMGRRMTKWELN